MKITDQIQEKITLAKSLVGKKVRSGAVSGMVTDVEIIGSGEGRSLAVHEYIGKHGVCVAVSFGMCLVPVDKVEEIPDAIECVPEGYVHIGKVDYATQQSVSIAEARTFLFWGEVSHVWKDRRGLSTLTMANEYAVPVDSKYAKEHNIGNWNKSGLCEPRGGWDKYEDLGYSWTVEGETDGLIASAKEGVWGKYRSAVQGYAESALYVLRKKSVSLINHYKKGTDQDDITLNITRADLLYLFGFLGMSYGPDGQPIFNKVKDIVREIYDYSWQDENDLQKYFARRSNYIPKLND